MSTTAVEKGDDTMQRCASCGVAEGDGIKLKKCTACYLVKYCSVNCQKEHRTKHKKECKKRAAELRDELLFKQPESSYLGDCPICCLPIPINVNDGKKAVFATCCSKLVCYGCDYANQKREREGGLQRKCPFCRKAAPKTQEQSDEQLMKRIEANDPNAICFMGSRRFHERDFRAAFEYWTRASALGDVRSHFELSCLYGDGLGVEKDKKKELDLLTEAAIGGHPDARHNLGCAEKENYRFDRAVKHWLIAAKLGFDHSLECVKNSYKAGLVSKEDYTAALRGYQVAIAAMKSPQREEAKVNAPNRVIF